MTYATARERILAQGGILTPEGAQEIAKIIAERNAIIDVLRRERDALEEAMERASELDDHPFSCRRWGDPVKRCDCALSIIRSALIAARL